MRNKGKKNEKKKERKKERRKRGKKESGKVVEEGVCVLTFQDECVKIALLFQGRKDD